MCAFREGIKGFECGLDLHDNPHDKTSPEYGEWNAGWLAADKTYYNG